MKYTTDIYDESIYSYSVYQDTSEMSSYSVDLSYNPYDSYAYDVFSKELEIQNFTSMEWNESEVADKRAGHACASLNGKIYVSGLVICDNK